MRLLGSGYWQRRRRLQLAAHPLCERCLREGRGPIPATVAHHLIRHGNHPNKFYLSPLESLCAPCHDVIAQGIEARGFDKAVDETGWPIDPRHPGNSGVLPPRRRAPRGSRQRR